MKKIVAYIPTYLLYWLGLVAYWLMVTFDSTAPFLYPVYNRLLGWSIDINDWAGLSLWTKEDDD